MRRWLARGLYPAAFRWSDRTRCIPLTDWPDRIFPTEITVGGETLLLRDVYVFKGSVFGIASAASDT